jgi:glycosyltransferase involved in cell wall biosynthesis
MSSPAFSFVILTFNEQIHLPRLLQSIAGLQAPLFILDSGSTDRTVAIAGAAGATILQHPFENHPKQWDFALKNFVIHTPWIIGLDADQVVSEELLTMLRDFQPSQVAAEVNGIYFNRKNYFKGRWLRHGGYFPKYMLKMFRQGKGFSDLNENLDHRFIVEGSTLIWKKGYLLEENLKENDIRFWIEKHNRYSDQVAREEVERMKKLRVSGQKPRFAGSPDERIAFLKNIWWKVPLYWRAGAYFFYRFFICFGFLDGKQGRIFHFLQAFWFRLLIDIKIEEINQLSGNGEQSSVIKNEVV